MVLIDSSVWIDFLTGASSPAGAALQALIADGSDICTTDVVLMEVLRGIKKDRDFRKVKKGMTALPILSAAGRNTYLEAAEAYRRARKVGITLNSTFDCLIAVTAVENDVPILHRDTDFDRLAKVIRGLRVITPENVLL